MSEGRVGGSFGLADCVRVQPGMARINEANVRIAQTERRMRGVVGGTSSPCYRLVIILAVMGILKFPVLARRRTPMRSAGQPAKLAEQAFRVLVVDLLQNLIG